MSRHRFFLHAVLGGMIAALLLWSQCTSASAADTPQPLSEVKQKEFAEGLRTLHDSLAKARTRSVDDVTDAAIFQKGLEWALKYDQEFSEADVNLLQRAVQRGVERADSMAAGKLPWTQGQGKRALGYISRVDGSIQPYGVIVPQSYDSTKPIRLDVVLHGSTRPVGMSELRLISRFDESDDNASVPPDQPFIELHPLGRVENCYRWAGETDVFEAIEDVARRYNIDRDRIVLRGMSMGASGTWHLGLKHPDQFVALGPYCGYVDTHRFSETPLPNFVKVGPLPEYQEQALHMLDSVDYAANAGVVPAIACMGEKDIFFQAHVLMGDAMRREGLTMVNLISPGTGHVIDPVTHAEQMHRIGEFATAGLNHQPQELRFVTWTLKYSRCHWIQVLGLSRHYVRAEIKARINDDVLEIAEPQNITRFAITSQLSKIPKLLHIGTTQLPVPSSITTQSKGIVVARLGKAWQIAGALGHTPLDGKRPGLHGPIDDAFTSPFLCVRGTGQPWNAAANEYTKAALTRFGHEWHHYFRGELPIKDDTEVTEEDVRTRNLILFGDPGSNPWIAKLLPHLPLQWSKDSFRMPSSGDGSKLQDFPAADHVPVMIAPNPLPGAGDHYIVLNSGHTFHEAELSKLNYLLFPRWGDWAVLKIDRQQAASQPPSETVVRAGFFDEQWHFPLDTK